MMCEMITTFKNLMSATFLVNQNFACQIEMMHMIISFVDLRLTEMTFDSLTEELAM